MPPIPEGALPHAAMVGLPVGGVFIVLLCFACCYINQIIEYFQKQQNDTSTPVTEAKQHIHGEVDAGDCEAGVDQGDKLKQPSKSRN